MSKRRCGLCGRDPAAGFASIDDVFYCHGDDDEVPTCYMRSQGAYLPADWLARDWTFEFVEPVSEAAGKLKEAGERSG